MIAILIIMIIGTIIISNIILWVTLPRFLPLAASDPSRGESLCCWHGTSLLPGKWSWWHWWQLTLYIRKAILSQYCAVRQYCSDNFPPFLRHQPSKVAQLISPGIIMVVNTIPKGDIHISSSSSSSSCTRPAGRKMVSLCMITRLECPAPTLPNQPTVPGKVIVIINNIVIISIIMGFIVIIKIIIMDPRQLNTWR